MPLVDYLEWVDSIQTADNIVVVVDLHVLVAAPPVVYPKADRLVVVDWGIDSHVEEMVLALPTVAVFHNIHKTCRHTQLWHRNWGRNSYAAYIYNYTTKM